MPVGSVGDVIAEISGAVVKISGEHVYVESGAVVQVSGQVVQISGQHVYLESGATIIVEISGLIVDISGGHVFQESGAIVLVSGQTVIVASGSIVTVSGVSVYQESGAVVLISGQTVIAQTSGEIVGITVPTTVDQYQQVIPAAATQLTALPAKTFTVKHMTAQSGGAVFIGAAAVTTGDGFELNEHEAINIDIDNANKLYAIASTSGDTICVIGVT